MVDATEAILATIPLMLVTGVAVGVAQGTADMYRPRRRGKHRKRRKSIFT